MIILSHGLCVLFVTPKQLPKAASHSVFRTLSNVPANKEVKSTHTLPCPKSKHDYSHPFGSKPLPVFPTYQGQADLEEATAEAGPLELHLISLAANQVQHFTHWGVVLS